MSHEYNIMLDLSVLSEYALFIMP